MAAPQQTAIPTYKETSNIPSPRTVYGFHEASNSTGSALARLLGAVPDATKQMGQEDPGPGPNEQEQLMALAAMGAERDRLKVAKGGTMFGLLRGQETTMDSYELERGRRQADLYAGRLRDAYAEAGLHQNDDPKAFAEFAALHRDEIFGGTLSDADPAFHHGFVTRIGGVFSDMAEAHAGNLDSFMQSQNKQAFQSRLNSKVDLELSTSKERDAFGNFMDSIMPSESGGNYNAFHNNAGNSRIRFTDMTVGEVLDWQKTGEWRRNGAGSSAVGKYQFIEKTLRETVRQSGISLDTKFSPAVQDKLIYARLAGSRGMNDFLEGKITAEEFLDSGLALEFAGLKKTNGKGHYDGDGLNRASHSSRKTIHALNAFRSAYQVDPVQVASTDDKGQLILRDGDENPEDTSLGGTLTDVERDYGISQSEARTMLADELIERLENDPELAEREDLEDLMAKQKVSKKDRQRVMDARDRARKQTRDRQQAAARKQEQDVVDTVTDWIENDNPEALESLREKDPRAYDAMLARDANPEPSNDEANAAFMENANFDDPDFMDEAISAFTRGEIDRETFGEAHRMHNAKKLSRQILGRPVLRNNVNKIKEGLPPGEVRDQFDDYLAIQISEIAEAKEGRPSVPEVLGAAQEVKQTLHELYSEDIERRMARPEYSLEEG